MGVVLTKIIDFSKVHVYMSNLSLTKTQARRGLTQTIKYSLGLMMGTSLASESRTNKNVSSHLDCVVPMRQASQYSLSLALVMTDCTVSCLFGVLTSMNINMKYLVHSGSLNINCYQKQSINILVRGNKPKKRYNFIFLFQVRKKANKTLQLYHFPVFHKNVSILQPLN